MRRLGWIPLALVLAGCQDRAVIAPSPTTYHWPARFIYKLDLVSDAQANGRLLLHYADSRNARFAIREDESYVVEHDSILKTTNEPGGPLRLVTFVPEDTLGWFVRLGSLGEFTDVQLGCDPAVPECRQALPSALPLELRRIIPRLSEWPVPRGSGWLDTLTFDDASRPNGTRGIAVTRYHVDRDTVIGGDRYWMVVWKAVRRTYLPGGGAIIEQPAVQEDGVTFIDQRRLMPIYSTWAGAATASASMRAAGATATGFRGRAYLAGSSFDSVLSRR